MLFKDVKIGQRFVTVDGVGLRHDYVYMKIKPFRLDHGIEIRIVGESKWYSDVYDHGYDYLEVKLID